MRVADVLGFEDAFEALLDDLDAEPDQLDGLVQRYGAGQRRGATPKRLASGAWPKLGEALSCLNQ